MEWKVKGLYLTLRSTLTNYINMKNESLYNDILNAIEKLYSNISWRIQQKRIDTYHSAPSVNIAKGEPLDIKAPLLKYIDEISQREPQGKPKDEKLDHVDLPNIAQPQMPTTNENATPAIKKTQNVDDLTRFFKAAHRSTELHPGISDKLKHSIIEHINASIRHARRGDTASAKMHADIASTAYQELAHYITDEEHTQFAQEIEEQLNVIMPQK